jgi:hypothetical protein
MEPIMLEILNAIGKNAYLGFLFILESNERPRNRECTTCSFYNTTRICDLHESLVIQLIFLMSAAVPMQGR